LEDSHNFQHSKIQISVKKVKLRAPIPDITEVIATVYHPDP